MKSVKSGRYVPQELSGWEIKGNSDNHCSAMVYAAMYGENMRKSRILLAKMLFSPIAQFVPVPIIVRIPFALNTLLFSSW
jgi:hypothetical protein